MDPQETSLYQLIIIASLVICSILIYAFITALHQQANYSQYQSKEISSGITLLENERKRIAADLHDDLGPILSATKMNLSVIQASSVSDAELLNKSIEYIDNMNSKIRTIAGGLMPAVLLDKGPVMAAEQFIQSLSFDHDIRIVLKAEPLPVLSQQASIHFFRIMQEIIHNTCKHARARELLLQVRVTGRYIMLATADDGTGFDFERTLRKTNGLGLSNIQSRVQLLNGKLNMRSVNGTQYYIEFPLAGNVHNT